MTDSWEDVYEKWGAKPPPKSIKKWILLIAILLVVSGGIVYGFGIIKQKNVPIETNKSKVECPVCLESTSWSECVGNKQSRTNYKCNVETGHNCQAYMEQVDCVPLCIDDCSVLGTKQCSGTAYKVCGNYDTDTCLEWGSVEVCPDNKCKESTCSNGICGESNILNEQTDEACYDFTGCIGDNCVCDGRGNCVNKYQASYAILSIGININQNEAGYLPENLLSDSFDRISSESLSNGFDISASKIDNLLLNLDTLPSEFSSWTDAVDYVCSSVLPTAKNSGYDSKNYDIVTVYLWNKNNWAPGFKYEDSVFHRCSNLPMAYILSLIQTSAYPGYNHPLPYCDVLGGTTHEFGHVIYKAPDYCCSDSSRLGFDCSGLQTSTVIDAICLPTNIPKNWCPSQCDYNVPNSSYCKQEQLLNVGSSTTPVFSNFVYNYAKQNGIYKK